MKKNYLRLLFIPFLLVMSSCEIIIPNINDYYNSSSKNHSTSILSNSISSTKTTSSNNIDSQFESKEFDDLSIHFLELGNKYTGDSVYIKAGENDILIDAGSRKDSAKTISNYINNYCTDGILEYVIATHAHQDHIAGFIDKNDGIFYNYKCENIIDFSNTNSSSNTYSEYIEARKYQINNGAHHYTALECYNNVNGGKRSYELGNNISLNILYQKYYEQKSNEENNYSVCVLLSQNNNHFLFTGDLEKSGEEDLVKNNDLPHVKVFKGGHHGSGNANCDTLLDTITPENICICTCVGTPEYTKEDLNTFPYQDTINRMAKHTENIYCTTQIDEDINSESYQVKPMNGTIIVISTFNNFSITGTNNSLVLKETEWFKKHRTWPSKIE